MLSGEGLSDRRGNQCSCPSHTPGASRSKMATRGTGLSLGSPGKEECLSAALQDLAEWDRNPTACRGPKAGKVPQLDSTEIVRRLELTRWELGNRRKILIRNLPQDCTSQDIHELLKDYEIKYCYVDRNKKTAFVTLLNGEQAQHAIQSYHQHTMRDREISVKLQPTDAVLCVTNLPPLLTQQEFEELVRAYGNTERCLLVYSELTGHSKGYGIVEYMKKDSASKARLELLGKNLDEFSLFAQWIDINQLTSELIHSKCLCVDKLKKDDSNFDELTQLFSTIYKPLFFQIAEDEGHSFIGFAVVEYETPEEAEEVRNSMDGTSVNGKKIQVSFCAPGSPGRSTLAALIAAQGMLQNNRKGLLPEPNPVQIVQSLNNPAMLQMLLQPQQQGRSTKHGSSSGRTSFVTHTVSQALLQLNQLHQKQSMGGNALLQNYSHLQMAQKQLLPLKSSQSNNCKPGLLGEAPVSVLQTAIGQAQLGSVEASQRDVPKSLMSFYHNQQLSSVLSCLTQDKHSALLALPEGSGTPSYIQQSGTVIAGQNQSQSQSSSAEPSIVNKSSTQTSLLGEPPRDIRLSVNPYLNLASVLAGSSLAGLGLRNIHQHVMDSSTTRETALQPGLENYLSYSQQYGDYSQTSSTLAFGGYSAYVQAPPTYYSTAPTTYQAESKVQYDKVSTNEKRAYTVSTTEANLAGYVDQYSEGSGENYSDSYFKRKKVC
ncbi:hypothetical protein GDO86_007992 [Hymenochirus boettgeri]|uniref:RRM domain-containing protein n=1 Tax=Hymenochirus boettgeri TaxID=247094 RepID=A0A8T2J148_9PIPI|nr:hypothetical protein GDO86_007992 [Hymenochirus boettgeri]